MSHQAVKVGVISLHKQFIAFQKYNYLHGVHHDGKGIDASVPAD